MQPYNPANRSATGTPTFCGSPSGSPVRLFIHAIGAAGHDVVKYALDTYGTGTQASLSVTHDANAWPADRYAGMPAPRADERVVLWLQNSHAAPIPGGGVLLDRMGAEAPVPVPQAVGPYASLELDVAELLPGLQWPAQMEVRAGRHVVRPRYEVTRAGRTRIAHLNVERAGLLPDPRHSVAAQPAGTRLPALPYPAARPVSQRRAADPDGGAADHPHRRVRRAGRWSPTVSSAACRATTTWRSTSPSSTSRRVTPTSSMTSATAGRPTAGCTRCCATRTGPAGTPPRAASARTSTTPQ